MSARRLPTFFDRTVVYTAVLQAALLLALMVTLLQMFSGYLAENARSEVRALAAALASQLGEPVARGQSEQIDTLLVAALSRDSVSEVRIGDQDGATIRRVYRDVGQIRIDSTPGRALRKEDEITPLRRLDPASPPVGTLFVVPEQSRVDEVRRKLWQAGLQTFAFLFLSGCLLLPVLLRPIAETLGRLVSVAQRLQPHIIVPQDDGLQLRELASIGGALDHEKKARDLLEQAVSSANARLRAALDGIETGVVLFDDQERLIYCNPGFYRLFQSAADLLVPGVSLELFLQGTARRGQFPDAQGREARWVQNILEQWRQPAFVGERRLAGDQWVIIESRRIERTLGSILVTVRDVTEVREARQARAEQAKAKERFLTSMSHEIRTPLNSLSGLINMLSETPLEPQQRTYLAHCQNAAQTLMEIINDVVDFSRLEHGAAANPSRPVNLQEVLRSVLDLGEQRARRTGVRLEADNQVPVGLNLLGDRLRLKQVLVNLLGNALKFTSDGKITISVRILRQEEASVWLVFEVCDTGCGIAPHSLPFIFEPFVQGDQTASGKIGGQSMAGSGLGLAICKAAVESMGGQITVASVVDSGTTFSIELPFGLAAVPAEEQTAEPDEGAGLVEPPHPLTQPAGTGGQAEAARRAIVVVDDNEVSLMIVEHLLKSSGYEVITAATGLDGLEAVWRERPALLMLDMQLPDMDGLEVLKRLRESATDAANTPVVALTAHGLPGDRERFLAAGMEGYVSKPFEGQMLIKEVSRVAHFSQNAASSSQLQALEQVLAGAIAGVGGDRALFTRIAQLAADQFELHARQFRSMALDLDYDAVIATAHRLKSSWASYAAPGEADLPDQVTRVARAHDAEGLNECCAQLARALTARAHSLRRWLELNEKGETA